MQVFFPTGALTHNHAQETNRFRPSAARAVLCQRACRRDPAIFPGDGTALSIVL